MEGGYQKPLCYLVLIYVHYIVTRVFSTLADISDDTGKVSIVNTQEQQGLLSLVYNMHINLNLCLLLLHHRLYMRYGCETVVHGHIIDTIYTVGSVPTLISHF